MEWIAHAPQPRPKFSHPGLNNCLNGAPSGGAFSAPATKWTAFESAIHPHADVRWRRESDEGGQPATAFLLELISVQGSAARAQDLDFPGTPPPVSFPAVWVRDPAHDRDEGSWPVHPLAENPLAKR